jgi:hypothetical protein
MDAENVYSWTKIKGINLGDVVNIAYDRTNDVILLVEDKGGRIGCVHHTFGSKAEGMNELIDALQTFHQKKFAEKEEIFEKIRKVISA